MTREELEILITEAHQAGMTFKQLGAAVGMTWLEFGNAHRDMTFTTEQEAGIIKGIKEWKEGMTTLF